MNMKRKLNRFIGTPNLEFGDYILFQEYDQGLGYNYKVSKPILAIYLGCFVADQTIGFNYVRWNNDKHTVYLTNEYITRYPQCKEVTSIECHTEWINYIDILGRWKHKPNWKEIIKSYRLQNLKQEVSYSEIEL
jgi:hypothetical protein